MTLQSSYPPKQASASIVRPSLLPSNAKYPLIEALAHKIKELAKQVKQGSEALIADLFRKNMDSFTEPSIRLISYSALRLQQSVRDILAAPTCLEVQAFVKRTNSSDGRSVLVNTPPFKLAVLLKSLHSLGKLELLDQILDDKFLELVTWEQPLTGQSPTSITPEDIPTRHTGGVPLPQLAPPPPLPKIRSKAREARVFAHKSFVGPEGGILNERLEFLGDSVLNSIVTELLYSWFPEANEGKLTQLRSELVCNAMLREWSRHYAFDTRLQLGKEIQSVDVNSKLYADVFEAYIGALAEELSAIGDAGHSRIKAWLTVLCGNEIAKKGKKDQAPVPKGLVDPTIAQNTLYSLIGHAAMPPVYHTEQIESEGTPEFRAVVSMNGEQLGVGVGRNMKTAKRMAAFDALENHPDLVDKYYRIRLAIPRAVKRVAEEDSKTNKKKTQVVLASNVALQPKENAVEPEKSELKVKASKFPLKVESSSGTDVSENDINHWKSSLDTYLFQEGLPFSTFKVEELNGAQTVSLTIQGETVVWTECEDLALARGALLKRVKNKRSKIVDYLKSQ